MENYKLLRTVEILEQTVDSLSREVHTMKLRQQDMLDQIRRLKGERKMTASKRLVKIGDTVRLKASDRKFSRLSYGEDYKVEAIEPNNGYWDGSSYITALSDKNNFIVQLRMYENFFDIMSTTEAKSMQNRKFTSGDRVISTRNTSDVPEGFIGTLEPSTGNNRFYDCEVTDDNGRMELFNEDELELLSVSNKICIPQGPDRDDITPYDIDPPKKTKSALDKQVSGNHYKDCGIQPIEYIHANGLSYLEGNVIKYTTRHSKKNGKADIEKAIHYLELILEMEYKGETN